MLSEWQVLDWLNRNSRSELSQENQNFITLIRGSQLDESDKVMRLNALISISDALENLLEEAEIEANSGVFCYARGRWQDAKRLLISAQHIYDHVNDLHRQTMLELLLYIVFHGHGDLSQAFYWSRQARAHLLKQVRVAIFQHTGAKERWYREVLHELTSELLQTPRYVYEWLFEFGGSHLSTSALMTREKLQKQIDSRDYSNACHTIEILRTMARAAPEKEEAGEALSLCALAHLDMGNGPEAQSFFRLAMVQYIPCTHEHTLMRWMVALMQMVEPAQQCQAVENMETCIREIAQLALNADRKALPQERMWYNVMGEAMRRTMKISTTKVI